MKKDFYRLQLEVFSKHVFIRRKANNFLRNNTFPNKASRNRRLLQEKSSLSNVKKIVI